MKTRIKAIERAKELALQYGNANKVAQCLEKEGLAGFLERSELESIITETEFIRHLLPAKPKKLFPRILGVIAVIMGIAAMSLGGGIPAVRGYSPGVYGIAAIVLGLILIIKPAAAKTDL